MRNFSTCNETITLRGEEAGSLFYDVEKPTAGAAVGFVVNRSVGMRAVVGVLDEPNDY